MEKMILHIRKVGLHHRFPHTFTKWQFHQCFTNTFLYESLFNRFSLFTFVFGESTKAPLYKKCACKTLMKLTLTPLTYLHFPRERDEKLFWGERRLANGVQFCQKAHLIGKFHRILGIFHRCRMLVKLDSKFLAEHCVLSTFYLVGEIVPWCKLRWK